MPIRVIECKDYNEISRVAAAMLAETVKLRPHAVLGLATGSTPLGTYRELIRMYEAGELDFSGVTTVNLDEYYPIAPDNHQSYRYFMNDNLFEHINVDRAHTYVPDGLAADPEKACRRYEEILASVGQVDIQLLGIGQNGHIGFNEPADSLVTATHVTELTPSTIAANARFFASEAEVPTRALTMGMGTILRARQILILANGEAKREAVATMLAGGLTTSCPASFLNLHPDVTLICDGAALGGKR